MYDSSHWPLHHIREEMPEQCSVAKITAGQRHKRCTHTRSNKIQRLLSTEGFANNEANTWSLWELVNNLLYKIPASTQRAQDEGVKEDRGMKRGVNGHIERVGWWETKNIKVNALQKQGGKQRERGEGKCANESESWDRQQENEIADRELVCRFISSMND